jgi:hypothetical protein
MDWIQAAVNRAQFNGFVIKVKNIWELKRRRIFWSAEQSSYSYEWLPLEIDVDSLMNWDVHFPRNKNSGTVSLEHKTQCWSVVGGTTLVHVWETWSRSRNVYSVNIQHSHCDVLRRARAGTCIRLVSLNAFLSKGRVIWGCDGCDCDGYCSLRSDITQSDKSLPTFRRRLLPPSSRYDKCTKLKAPGSFEALETSYQALWRHISESCKLHCITICCNTA